MNIITDRWIPVRRKSGVVCSITPAEIADTSDPPVALLWPRPDFNLACLELLIGLTYVAMPPENDEEWRDTSDADLFSQLELKLAAMAPWFSLDGDGPRFMQDLEKLDGKPSGVDMLMLDSAGGQTAKNNADMMVRRNRYRVLGRPAAAMALYTLQDFAPSGGAGNRTSMRGGGPLVTLVEPVASATIWQIVYANTPSGMPVSETDAPDAFPWLSATRVSKNKGTEVHEPEMTQEAPHWSVYFGMPRRLRLQFDSIEGSCDITGTDDVRLLTGVVQKPYGNNYGVWVHPCSPYYRKKPGEEAFPAHPKPGRLGYRQFIGLSLRDDETELRDLAVCVDRFRQGRIPRKKRLLLRLIVGGWAMDNMKPVDFVYGYAPLPAAENAQLVEHAAICLLKAAEEVARQLVISLKSALFVDVSDKGVIAEARSAFYDATDGAFHRALDRLVIEPDDKEARTGWLAELDSTAMVLFDQRAIRGISDISPERAEKIHKARNNLKFTLKGFGKNGVKLYGFLNLEPPESSRKRRKERAA